MPQTAAQELQVTEICKAIASATKAVQARNADFPSLVTEAGELIDGSQLQKWLHDFDKVADAWGTPGLRHFLEEHYDEATKGVAVIPEMNPNQPVNGPGYNAHESAISRVGWLKHFKKNPSLCTALSAFTMV